MHFFIIILGTPSDYDVYFDIDSTSGEVSMLQPVPDPGRYAIAVQATEDVTNGKSAFNYLEVGDYNHLFQK